MRSIHTTEQMTDYLRDESRSTGEAEAVYFPASEEDVIRILRQYPHKTITVQGSRTGLTAGAVPQGGIVLNMSRMNRILSDLQPGCDKVRVQPGLALQTLRDALQGTGRWFPPDPTETSASIGGMIANDSSGARTYKYGSMRKHVQKIRVVLRNGEVLQLRRSQEAADGMPEAVEAVGASHGGCAHGLEFSLCTESGRGIRGRLPEVPVPDVSKDVAGYYIRPDMDMIDLFIGSEGTLGIVTEAELLLQPLPEHVWGCMVFFGEEAQALEFTTRLRQLPRAEAIEYFDRDVLALMGRAQRQGEILVDAVPVPEHRCAIYVEYAGTTRQEMLRLFRPVQNAIGEAGGDPRDSWLAIHRSDLSRLKDFRHAAPVCVNHVIAKAREEHPSITKLGTDMSVPDIHLRDVFRMYRAGLAGGASDGPEAPGVPDPFRSAIFGHIGDNHVHVNIMPRDEDEYVRGKALYTGWAQQVVAMGGSVSAEHGIGKLKRWLLKEMYTEEQRRELAELKALFDPGDTLGKGNIL